MWRPRRRYLVQLRAAYRPRGASAWRVGRRVHGPATAQPSPAAHLADRRPHSPHRPHRPPAVCLLQVVVKALEATRQDRGAELGGAGTARSAASLRQRALPRPAPVPVPVVAVLGIRIIPQTGRPGRGSFVAAKPRGGERREEKHKHDDGTTSWRTCTNLSLTLLATGPATPRPAAAKGRGSAGRGLPPRPQAVHGPITWTLLLGRGGAGRRHRSSGAKAPRTVALPRCSPVCCPLQHFSSCPGVRQPGNSLATAPSAGCLAVWPGCTADSTVCLIGAVQCAVAATRRGQSRLCQTQR